MIEMEVSKKAQELAEAIVNSPEYKRFMAAKGRWKPPGCP